MGGTGARPADSISAAGQGHRSRHAVRDRDRRTRRPAERRGRRLEQNGKAGRVFALDRAGQQSVTREGADRTVITGVVGKRDVPELQAGPARIVVRAARPVFFGLRHIVAEAVRDVTVRLEPPRVSRLSTFHYINQGGAEFVVYRASPPEVESGVRVGDRDVSRVPGIGRRHQGRRAPARRVLRAAPRSGCECADLAVRARRVGDQTATAALDHRVFPKPFAHSRIEITDSFLARVVPAIAAAIAGHEAGHRTAGPAAVLSADQLRPAPAQRRDRSPPWRGPPRRRCCGPMPSRPSATRRWRRSSPTAGRTSTRARRSITRRIWGSISR